MLRGKTYELKATKATVRFLCVSRLLRVSLFAVLLSSAYVCRAEVLGESSEVDEAAALIHAYDVDALISLLADMTPKIIDTRPDGSKNTLLRMATDRYFATWSESWDTREHRYFDNFPLSTATYRFRAQRMIDALLSHGANPAEKGSDGNSVTLNVLQRKILQLGPDLHMPIFDTMVRHGGAATDIDASGNNILHYTAAIYCSFASSRSKHAFKIANYPTYRFQPTLFDREFPDAWLVVNRFISLGVPINAKNRVAATPLLVCLGGGFDTGMVDALIDHGADLNAYVETGRSTGLRAANFIARHAAIKGTLEEDRFTEYKRVFELIASNTEFLNRGYGRSTNTPLRSAVETAFTMERELHRLIEKESVLLAEQDAAATKRIPLSANDWSNLALAGWRIKYFRKIVQRALVISSMYVSLGADTSIQIRHPGESKITAAEFLDRSQHYLDN